MSYSHLTITERIKIEAYLELGLKPCQIANKLGVHRVHHLKRVKTMPKWLFRSLSTGTVRPQG